MKNLLILSIIIVLFSCSENETEQESDIIPEKDTEVLKKEIEEEEVKEETPQPVTVVALGDVSDLSVYSPFPYSEEGAGYQGTDLVNLTPDKIVNFTHVTGTSDTDALESTINNISFLGGGQITIKRGDYLLRDVQLKPNVHITIESGTTIKIDNSVRGFRYFFAVSSAATDLPVENVRIVGLGTPENRPKLILQKFRNTFNRAISIGNAKNILIQNFTIQDDFTFGTAIAFNPVKVDDTTAKIAENVTVTNVSLTNGSIGYGLVQTNVGKNILLRNLSSQGGMTCRIEAHTGRQYDLGVDNIVIKNVASIRGKAAVLLQPHSVVNGRILVDGAKSEGSSWTLFIKEGFVASDSKRRERGTFDSSSTFKNISLEASDDEATLSFKNFSFVPTNLKNLYNPPTFNPILEDSNYKVDADGIISKEAPIVGPSVAVVYIDATYPLNIPNQEALVLTGKTTNKLKILRR